MHLPEARVKSPASRQVLESGAINSCLIFDRARSLNQFSFSTRRVFSDNRTKRRVIYARRVPPGQVMLFNPIGVSICTSGWLAVNFKATARRWLRGNSCRYSTRARCKYVSEENRRRKDKKYLGGEKDR